jgi:2-polyprenyl-6-methoxyphenol hydroxylase-like FAD-dependent oxidoreductase
VAAGGGGAFCGQAQEFVTQVQAAVTAQSQQSTDLGQKLQTLYSQLQSITPPPAIASDWHTAISALQQLGQDYQGVNLSDPQQLQQLEQKIQPVVAQLGASGQHIDDYLRTQCGISVDTAASTTG